MNGPRLLRSFIPVVALWTALALPAGDVEGQALGTIVVTVRDVMSFEHLEGARIRLDTGELTADTDEEGRVVFTRVPVGEVTLRVTHAGYGSVVEALTVTSMEETLLQVQLPRIETILDEILVLAGRQREGRAQGHSEALVEAEDSGPMTAADLLARQVPGLRVDQSSGAIGSGTRVRIRGTSSISGREAPYIYLDGLRISNDDAPLVGSREGQGLYVLEMIPASEIKRIRVLRGPAAAARYGESANGVILIETRKGDPNDD